MKKLNKKGFTMAELLIVVAIIAVLVAIAIPIFSAQLEKSRDAVSISNIRAAYAEAQAAYLTGSSDSHVTVDKTNSTATVSDVVTKGTVSTDDYSGLKTELPFASKLPAEPAAGTYKLKFTYDANGDITAVAFE